MDEIEVKKFGEQYVACDGERTAMGTTEELARQAIEEMRELSEKAVGETTPAPSPPPQKHAAPIHNKKGLDWFDGTSWGNN